LEEYLNLINVLFMWIYLEIYYTCNMTIVLNNNTFETTINDGNFWRCLTMLQMFYN
jgi:hypothetical protein